MKKSLLLALALLFALASFAGADTLNTGAGNTWNPWVTPKGTGSFAAPAFWDNVSWDGTGCNVGYWVTGSGCTNHPTFLTNSPHYTGTPGSDFYFGDGDGIFTFKADATSSLTGVTAGVGVSDLSAVTQFGWFNADNRTEQHALINGGVTAPMFDVPSGNYGFYATVTDARFDGGKITYYSDTLDSLNRAHFVIFDISQPGTTRYAFGFEDLTGHSDYDYNDVMGTLSYASTPVPEPGTMALLGLGLAGVARAVRRKK